MFDFRRFLILPLAGLTLCMAREPTDCWANDSVSSVTLRGLELSQTANVALREEVLTITPERIEVEYVFENTSPLDESLLVAFPMPHERVGIYGQYNRFEDFSVRVDGKKQPYQTECRAFQITSTGKPGTEVTSELKVRGLPLCSFEGMKTEKDLSSRFSEILGEATRVGLLSRLNADEELQPNYSLQRKHFWKQSFPAGKRVRIAHHYKPSLGMNSVSQPSHEWKGPLVSWSGALFSGMSCLFRVSEPAAPGDAACLKQAEAQGLSGGALFARYLDYILTTANTWKDGIEKFSLRVSGAKAVLVELDGVQDFDLGSYKTERKKFRPMKELIVEFLGSAEAPLKVPSQLGLKKEIDGPAHCRSEPNTQSGKMGTPIADGERVLILERRDDWYRIRHQERECWTHRRNLRFR